MTLTASAFFSSAPGQISAQAEDAFFRAIKTGNRTFKFTGAERLADLDAALIEYLKPDAAKVDTVLDIGISSGVTTLELLESLKRAGYAPSMTATDLAMRATIVPVLPGCRALVDDDGHVLQYEFAGRALKPWRRRLDYFNGMVFVRNAAHALCDHRARKAMREAPAAARHHVALVTPRLTARRDVTAIEDNIMVHNRDFVRRFDLVRAANVLNKGYFPEGQLRRAFTNVLSYLSGPGAVLLVARTLEKSGNHATLFRVSPDGRELAVVARIGDGSEVEDLVLEMPLPDDLSHEVIDG